MSYLAFFIMVIPINTFLVEVTTVSLGNESTYWLI